MVIDVHRGGLSGPPGWLTGSNNPFEYVSNYRNLARSYFAPPESGDHISSDNPTTESLKLRVYQDDVGGDGGGGWDGTSGTYSPLISFKLRNIDGWVSGAYNPNY